MKKIVKIEPVFEPRIWGGSKRFTEYFNYISDVKPIGESFNVIALEGKSDCKIPELNTTLAKLYRKKPHWFECECEELPIRVNILDPSERLSIQIHPDDAFARSYNGGRGKPEAWVIVDSVEDGSIEFGHYAKSREEFKEWTKNQEWDKLLRYLKTPKDGFIEIPSGTLHAVGKGVFVYNIARNADCTLRLYDYDRVDPKTGKKREIHTDIVCEQVNIPDKLIEFQMYPYSKEHGVKVTRYWDEPGLYTLIRLQIEKEGKFLHDNFAFYTCVRGRGSINGISILQGETVLVPCHMGWMHFEGDMDLFLASYRNEKV